MSDTPSEWRQVADSLSGLAMKLKLHYEQATSEADASAAGAAAGGPGGAGAAGTAGDAGPAVGPGPAEAPGEEEKAEVRQALDRLGDAVEGAFEAVRNAVRDPAVKEDVREVGATLKGALTNTLAEARRRAQER